MHQKLLRKQEVDVPSPKVKSQSSAEQSLAKALKHPIRVEIMAILDIRTSSPARLSEELCIPLGKVTYHVKELLKFRCIELVNERRGRGGVEHFYRAIKRPYFHDEDWRQLPRMARQGISSSVMAMIARDAGESFDAGVFDRRDDRHLSRTPLLLDDQAWKQMNLMLNDLVERCFDLQAEAAERLSKTGDIGISARMILMGFETEVPE